MYAYFFGILSTIKMKFGQCGMKYISNMILVQCLRLVPGPFIISLKLQCNEIWPFLILDIYHF